MSERIFLSDPPIELRLRRTRSARRLSLRVSRLDGQVTLTAPPKVPKSKVMAFAEDHAPWLRAQLAQLPPADTVAPGATIPFRGRPHRIALADLRRPEARDGQLLCPAQSAAPAATLRAWLREQARARLVALSTYYAAQLGRQTGRITLRDTRSRWGSCSSSGNLMYSWRLILAPDAVSAYVAAHEVAHLVEMNHSPAFWQVVARLDPDWRVSRDWLRSEGAALLRLKFDD